MSLNPIEVKLRAAYGVLPEGEGHAAESSPEAPGSPAPASVAPEAAAPPAGARRFITLTVYVMGINGELNEPDIFVTQVTLTEDEYYEEGTHLDMAEDRAKQEGFIEPFFSFDERESRIIGTLRRLFGHD